MLNALKRAGTYLWQHKKQLLAAAAVGIAAGKTGGGRR
jgi:hypothetical protein